MPSVSVIKLYQRSVNTAQTSNMVREAGIRVLSRHVKMHFGVRIEQSLHAERGDSFSPRRRTVTAALA